MRQPWITPLLAILLVPLHALGANAPAAGSGPELMRDLIRADTTIAAGPTGKRPCYSPDMLERFYSQRKHAPAWTDPAAVNEARALLAQADGHGLDAADYHVDAAPDAAASAEASARSDAQLTSAMMRLLADLHCGRVTSEYSAPFLAAKLAAFDPPARLSGALAERKVADLAKAAQPNIPVYGRLMGVLAAYRTLAATPDVALAPLPTKASVKPGEAYADADALRRRLVQLGDLGDGVKAPAGTYSKALADGVKAFQVRHGLDAEGVLGRATLHALSIPIKQRVTQLELTLERLRWAPQFPPGRILAVNVPAYRLLAYDTTRDLVAQLDMRVIVGKAAKSQTPLFVDQMRHVELNPYWNVPRSIEKEEILAKLASDPEYLDKNDMELLPRTGGDPLEYIDAPAIEGLRAGTYRVRQRPGEKNALGAVKFVMPNPMSIYLHSTPTRALFAKSRRDFSHGCIRVEHPLELAEFVMADPVKWNVASIDAAIGNGKNQWVKLPATVQVVLFYATAMVERDGRVMFYDDIYKLDPPLSQALKKIKRAGK